MNMGTNLNMNPDITPVTSDNPARYKAELRKAAQELESIFMAQLYRIMNKNLYKSELFGNSPGQELYQDMFINEVARTGSIAQEIGIAEMIFQSLGGDTTGSQAGPAAEPDSGPGRLEINEVKNATTECIGAVRHP